MMFTAKTTHIHHTLADDTAIILTVALISMLAPLNSTMMAVTLPQIMHEFGANIGAAGWLVTAYLLAIAALQPLAGKLGDRLADPRWAIGFR